MRELQIRINCLGFELHDGERLVALYRATEELPREESPKPSFAPIYTPSGRLITEYRPKDHLWHTGLFFGWVHVNEANLWGGGRYVPEAGQYQDQPGTHGRQAHERFDEIATHNDAAVVRESIAWIDAADGILAREERRFEFQKLPDRRGTFWRIGSQITPVLPRLTLGASRAARYSGHVLRMGPPFADASHRTSEGLKGHEAIMGTRARWCCTAGACGGAVAIFDHPANPRFPTCWFTRRNLMGPALLMDGDLELQRGQVLALRYGFVVLDEAPPDEWLESLFAAFSTD